MVVVDRSSCGGGWRLLGLSDDSDEDDDCDEADDDGSNDCDGNSDGMFVVLTVVAQWGTGLVDAEPITAVIMTGIMRLLQRWISPWYYRTGSLGVKHQVTYLHT